MAGSGCYIETMLPLETIKNVGAKAAVAFPY
jgi:hypothetical protein